MTPQPTAPVSPAGEHIEALKRAYLLIEAAQDRADPAAVTALDLRAQVAGWADVRVLLHLARSLAAREAGLDDTEQVQAMLDTAGRLADPALLALALATGAQRTADARRVQSPIVDGAEPLARAVALLDSEVGLLVHRVGAHIEVAAGFQALGLWALAQEHYELLDLLFEQDRGGPWAEVLSLQRRVVAYNRLDLALDEACAFAEVGDWDTAQDLARRALARTLAVLDPNWPASWAATIHAFADLFAALSGERTPADRVFVAQQAHEPDTDDNLAMLAIAEAIRARRSADLTRSARLAEAHQSAIGPALPLHLRLLALSLAAHTPHIPAAARAYLRELITLRWNSRLARQAAMQASIQAERRRAEHEQLREQVLVDDLTGLGNRRAYTAYLELVRRSVTGSADGPDRGWNGPDRRFPGPETRELVVMMLDVDHFKAVNDTYGHDVGDEVLRRIGALLAAQLRPVDLAARLGGDEFVVIMAQDAEEVGEARARAIVAAVHAHPWHDVAPGLAISVSLGLHRGPVSDPRLGAEADRLLYVAKRGGRGRMATS